MSRAMRSLARDLVNARRGQQALARSRQVARSYVASGGEEPLEVVAALNSATQALRQADVAASGDRANLVSDPARALPWGEGWTYTRDEAAADDAFVPQTFDSTAPWEIVPYSYNNGNGNGYGPRPGDYYYYPVTYRLQVPEGSTPPGDWYGESMPFLRTTAEGLRPGARYRWSADLAVQMRRYDIAFLGFGNLNTDLHDVWDNVNVSEWIFGTWFDVTPQHVSVDFTATATSIPLWIGIGAAQMGDDRDPEITKAVWFRNTLLEALPTTDPNRGG